ncbi:MAG: signal peptidase II [Deltaproteobacteria bacterium]|nr:signal peptidase II [Deltaproteobacteria bacterium]
MLHYLANGWAALKSALKTKWRLTAAWAVAALALDLATKAAARRFLSPWDPLPVIDDFFNLVLVYNTGAAFSLMAGEEGAGQSLKMVALAIAALAPFVYFFVQARAAERGRLAALGLIWGGALGNIHDRLRWGGVVDFLDFHWRGHHWPAFNFADTAICLGAAVLGFCVWREKPARPEVRG